MKGLVATDPVPAAIGLKGCNSASRAFTRVLAMMTRPLRSMLPECCYLVRDRGTEAATVSLCLSPAARLFPTAHRQRLATP